MQDYFLTIFIMKKMLLIPVLLITLIFGQVANAAFADVNSNTSYESSIQWMAENGVIQGYPDGTFKPDQCVNRAEFLKMMYLTLDTNIIVEDGFAGSNYYDDFFSDTSTDEWYWPYVEQALRDQAIEGYPDGTFKPGQCVNRVEAIKMGILGFDMLGENSLENRDERIYQDAMPGENWFDTYLYSGIDAHVIGTDHVFTDDSVDPPLYSFYPGESMSRKEVAEMLYRMKTREDNGVFGYVSTMSPNSLNYYISPNSGVSFLMPDGWWVDSDTYNATAAGVEADYPTIIINGPTEAGEETIAINQRQMDCGGGEFQATCFDLNSNYKMGAFDRSLDANYAMNKIMLTFRDPTSDWATFVNNAYKYQLNYPNGADPAGNDMGTLPEEASWVTLRGINFNIDIIVDQEWVDTGIDFKLLDIDQYAQTVWDYNVGNPNPNFPDKQVGDLNAVVINGFNGYQFTLDSSYEDESGGYVLDEEYLYTMLKVGGSKVIIWYPTAYADGSKIMKSLVFIQ